MTDWTTLKAKMDASPFRSRFNLSETELKRIAEKGWNAIERESRTFIINRLSPALPHNDGSQTPMRGHPCFKAQHATGSCCRGCLEKFQHIPKGRPLTDEEINSIVDHLLHWMRWKYHSGKSFMFTPDLF